MQSPRLDWVVDTWNRLRDQFATSTACCSQGHEGTIITSDFQNQIQLSCEQDSFANQVPKQSMSKQGDAFDTTFTPRSFGNFSFNPWSMPITPRQRDLRDQLELPSLHTYPVPPTCTEDDGDEERKRKLLEMYQEFALDLHTGLYLTQLTSNRDYSDIHCQLMGDMTTLKLDQSNGRIIEFPLTNVSKVYRIIKNDDKWYTTNSSISNASSANAEQIVVVEFMRRKLAFVFQELAVSQRFLICMELLIRRAQQKHAKKALRSLTPTFPAQQTLGTRQCATPRHVQDAASRSGSTSSSPAQRGGNPSSGSAPAVGSNLAPVDELRATNPDTSEAKKSGGRNGAQANVNPSSVAPAIDDAFLDRVAMLAVAAASENPNVLGNGLSSGRSNGSGPM